MKKAKKEPIEQCPSCGGVINADMGTLIFPKTKRVFYAQGRINSTPKGWRITIIPKK